METKIKAIELIEEFTLLGADEMKAAIGMMIDVDCAMDGTDPVEFAVRLAEVVAEVNQELGRIQ